jgi:hypothetical protein
MRNEVTVRSGRSPVLRIMPLTETVPGPSTVTIVGVMEVMSTRANVLAPSLVPVWSLVPVGSPPGLSESGVSESGTPEVVGVPDDGEPGCCELGVWESGTAEPDGSA